MAGKWGTPAQRFWPKVDKAGPMLSPYLGPCWIWTAGCSTGGYGQFRAENNHKTLAHRWAYEHICGPVPAGLQLDHLCRIRRCVNPAHLEPVTQRENLLRGATLPARNARKTHCIHGHPFDEINTLVASSGARRCRTCIDRWSREQTERERSAA